MTYEDSADELYFQIVERAFDAAAMVVERGAPPETTKAHTMFYIDLLCELYGITTQSGEEKPTLTVVPLHDDKVGE